MKGRSLLALPALMLVLACEGNKEPTAPAVPVDPSKIISDGAHSGGNRDFFFLPPLVPLPLGNPDFELGKFNNALQPSLKIVICELVPNGNPPALPTATTGCARTVKTFEAGTVKLVNLPRRQFGWWTLFGLPPDGFYYVLWDTRQSGLVVTKYYRIKVFIDGDPDHPLGIADVDPISSLRQWKFSLTGQVIQLIDDVLLPIPFRVENGALQPCIGAVRCTSVTVGNIAPDGTHSQVVKLQGIGGAIAGVKLPDGWLSCPQGVTCPPRPSSVVLTIAQVNTGAKHSDDTQGVPCHVGLPLLQFNGCVNISTIPKIVPYNEAGDQFGVDITTAVCFVLSDRSPVDPRYAWVQIWSSDVDENETPRPLPSAPDAGILTPDLHDCGSNFAIAPIDNSNGLTRFASAGWRKVTGGLGRLFGVQTAYAVDLGLGGLSKSLSHIGPALTAEIRPNTSTELALTPGSSTTVTARLVGTQKHDSAALAGLGAVTLEGNTRGIPGLPVTFTLEPPTESNPVGNGTLTPFATEGEPTQSITVTTSPMLDNSLSGGFASVIWTVPTEAGTYTLKASGPARGGPVIFTATVPAALPNPFLVFTGADLYTANGSNFVTYNLAVTNYQAYPEEMFASAPDLPACGLNTSASRTWVDIYDASNNSWIYGFCALGSPADLQSIWFSEPAGRLSPLQVYIKLVDRRAGVTYTSNILTLPQY